MFATCPNRERRHAFDIDTGVGTGILIAKVRNVLAGLIGGSKMNTETTTTTAAAADASLAAASQLPITKNSRGFAIKIPFALNSALRQAFPSVTWDPAAKAWQVGPRSGKRLEQWAATVATAAQEAASCEEREMNEAELEKLHQSIAQVRSELANTMKRLLSLSECESRMLTARAELDAARAQLDIVKSQVAAQKASADAAQKSVEELLAKVIDLRVVEQARAVLAANHGVFSGRQKFRDAQAVLIAQRKLLRAAGWGLRGLDFMISANFNRRDRDSMSSMPAGAMLDLYKYEPENNS